ncbi:MAG TPA: SH3 domain-containing protein [Nitrospirota bacterium]|nr:SH3 domain-containing protein [Nitrospirota bacterium]
MAKTIVMTVFIAVALWHAPTLYAADEYYVQSVKAKVMSGATFKSVVLGEVDRGNKFISSGKEGGWIKVKYNNGDGYVHSLVLLTHPPKENVWAITADEQELRRGFRRRASSAIGIEADRGLDTDVGNAGSKGERVDYESLQEIELFTMSSWEIKLFMEGNE